MIRKYLLLTICTFSFFTAQSQVDSTIVWWKMDWWREARFGMFIHWGVYSVPAGEWKGKPFAGYAEHIARIKKIPRAEYLGIAHSFNPTGFNADEWIATAKKAGMGYFIITAKHHDGFAMYDSQVSDYNIIKQTPFRRDPIAELAAACKRQGVKFGFYYSHAFDWEHPDAPGNDWEYNNPGGDLNLFDGANWFDVHPELLPKAINYVNTKSIPQILELINKYHPDIMWFDTPHKLPFSENLRILDTIRKVAPGTIINGRLARNGEKNYGDYKNTADRPAEFFPVEGDWEAIPTTNESYGYHKYDNSHKPASHFIKLLANAASRGGNLLMNIGPMGNGKFDQRDIGILSGIGSWMDVNGESIHGTSRSPLPIQSWGVSTIKNDKLYLHVFNWPDDNKLVVGGLKSEISKAWLLSDQSRKELPFKKLNENDITLTVPTLAPDTINTVIVVETIKPVICDSVRLIDGRKTRLLAFDSNLLGGGFRFGDGKAKRYFVEGWNRKDQEISWQVRLNKPVSLRVALLYAGSPDSEGTFSLLANKDKLEGTIEPGQKTGTVYSVNPGTIKLKKGVNLIRIVPEEIKNKELMKLLEVQLIPVE